MITVRLQKHGNSFGINIPRKLLAALAWAPGDIITLEEDAAGLRAVNLAQHLLSVQSRRRPRGEKRPQADS